MLTRTPSKTGHCPQCNQITRRKKSAFTVIWHTPFQGWIGQTECLCQDVSISPTEEFSSITVISHVYQSQPCIQKTTTRKLKKLNKNKNKNQQHIYFNDCKNRSKLHNNCRLSAWLHARALQKSSLCFILFFLPKAKSSTVVISRTVVVQW